MKKTKNLL